MIFIVANFLDRRGRKIPELSTLIWTFFLSVPVIGLIVLQGDFSSTITLFPVLFAMLFCAGAHLGHLGALAVIGGLSGGLPMIWTMLKLKPELMSASPFLSYVEALSRFGWSYVFTIIGIFITAYVVWWMLRKFLIDLPLVVLNAIGLVFLIGLTFGIVVDGQLKDYQRGRLVAFMDPGLNPRGSGYNSLQARIAIGSGGVVSPGSPFVIINGCDST